MKALKWLLQIKLAGVYENAPKVYSIAIREQEESYKKSLTSTSIVPNVALKNKK